MATKISVITVAFNAEKCIEKTIKSFASQVAADKEYVVIDGASKDSTLDLISAHGACIDRLVSEPDRGIYDAMNKGIALSTGDVLFFLNADDAFTDPHVLRDVASRFEANPELDLLYGNVIYTSPSGNRRRSFHWVNERNIYFGDLCHQAVFARRRLFEEIGGYDLQYAINADYDWILRAFARGIKYEHLPRTIALFEDGGFHTKDPARLLLERNQIKEKHNSRVACFFGYWMLRIELKLRKTIGQDI